MDRRYQRLNNWGLFLQKLSFISFLTPVGLSNHPLKSMMQSHITFITAPSFPGKFGLYVKYSCVLSALHFTLRNCRPAISPNSQLLVYTVRKAGQDKILE